MSTSSTSSEPDSLPPPAPGDAVGLWQLPVFRTYAGMRFSWIFAQEILTISLGWLIYERTRSTFALGMVGFSGFAPSILLSLFTGTAADRFDRGMIMRWCGLTLAACALALCLLTLSSLVWPVYMVVVVQGIARAFAQPASKAMVPNLAPAPMLSRLIAGTTLVQRVASICGPAAGGLLIGLGAPVPFAAACLCACLALAAAFSLGPQRARGMAKQRPDLAMLLGGYRYVWSRPVILGSMSLDLIAVLFAGATALLPFYVAEIFHAGPWALGALRMAIAAGALATALRLARKPIERGFGPKLLVSVGLYGLATIAFGLCTNIWFGMLFLFILGAADSVSVVLRNALIQVNTPDAMQGRVSAVHSVTVGASNDLGEFESGVLASAIGGVPAVVVGGVMATLAALSWARLFPALWRADRIADTLPED
ncbi:MAG: transporter [Betaproteobacteria bacterium]|nr:transporter [Betaproteobacteria bacterium]